jgi:NAD+ kinase
MLKAVVIYNKKKQKSIQFYKKMLARLEEKKIQRVEKERISEADFMIVIGGDGTLLGASKKVLEKNIPVLAINQGSLGFLTETRTEEAFDMLDLYIAGKCKYEERNFLELEVDGEKYYALNDIVIGKKGILSRMLSIDLYANSEYVNTYRADGIIVATPTGSTAYSLSAGGPIVSPNLEVLIITPIAPHTLSARPLIISKENTITFGEINEEYEATITMDGQIGVEYPKENGVKIKISKKKLKLMKPENRDYYSVLREKLKWGDKLC